MAKFLAEYEMPDWARDELEHLHGRIRATGVKLELWDKHLRQHTALGPTLEAAQAKRDIVAMWIVTHNPHPSPPLAIMDMALAVDCADAEQVAGLKRNMPPDVFEPFPIPAGQEI